MKTRMTWDEIQEKYPKMFVYLTDVEWDKERPTIVASAVVEHATTNPESEYVTRTIKGVLLQEYTAPGTTLPLGALMV